MNCNECGCEKVYKFDLCEECYRAIFVQPYADVFSEEDIVLGEGTVRPTGYYAKLEPAGLVFPFSFELTKDVDELVKLYKETFPLPYCADLPLTPEQLVYKKAFDILVKYFVKVE